jgi:YegS C-terminal NAD kinase beta sandwich-like domain
MIRKGEAWGDAARRPPDVEVEGDDAALARSVVTDGAPPLVRYRPSPTADLARAVGLRPESPSGTELVLDALEVVADDGTVRRAVNAVVAGHGPDRITRWTRRHDVEVTIDGRPAWDGRATGVVVANGQFLRGVDIVPRGHPGDGRAEVQVYALAPGERGAMRRRLPTGTHVPHPQIRERSGRLVEVRWAAPRPLEGDGLEWPASRLLRVVVLPGALRILV